MNSNYIAHYGIKGQKKGIRRYQTYESKPNESGFTGNDSAAGSLLNSLKSEATKYISKQAPEVVKTVAKNATSEVAKTVAKNATSENVNKLIKQIPDSYKKEATNYVKEKMSDKKFQEETVNILKEYGGKYVQEHKKEIINGINDAVIKELKENPEYYEYAKDAMTGFKIVIGIGRIANKIIDVVKKGRQIINNTINTVKKTANSGFKRLTTAFNSTAKRIGMRK